MHIQFTVLQKEGGMVQIKVEREGGWKHFEKLIEL